MGVFQNNLMGAAAAAASAGGGDFYSHQISNSIRADTNNGYLHRTPSSAGNRATWTFSTWIKLAQMGTGTRIIYSAGSSGDQDGYYRLYYSSNKLKTSSANANFLTPSNIFRDPSAWYHIVWKQGSNTSTLYVNGEQIATASVSGNTAVNNNTLQCIGTNSFGGSPTNGDHLDGYFAETIMIDGTALDADSFGETKNGVWIPKDASGLTFGTNGFHLKYESSSDLGNDSSGNNNDWTAVNLATHDQMLDTPTFNSDSNGGNFATYNPLINTGQSLTFADGNLNLASSGTFWSSGTWNQGTMGVTGGNTGKYYYEFCMFTNGAGSYVIGVGTQNGSALSTTSYSDGVIFYNDHVDSSGTTVLSGLTGTSAGEVVGIAFDASNGKVWFRDDAGYFNSGDPANGTGESGTIVNYAGEVLIPLFNRSTNAGSQYVNFGQEGTFGGNKTAGGNVDDTGYGNFYYPVPSGFKALCQGNLPTADAIDPAQTDDNYPQKLFGAKLYTGDGGSSTGITGVGFQPDFVWIKRRNAAENHNLYDSTRGANKRIQSNRNVTETTEGLPAFGSDGFTVDASGGINNVSSQTYVAWNWRANGGTTSSGSGDLTSTHQVDPSGGFSIVKAVGDGGSGDKTVSHGLSSAPTVILAKNRDTTYNWDTYFAEGVTAGSGMRLNTTETPFTGRWGTVNSSIFTCKDNYTWAGTNNYIYYCFTNTEGYIKSGSYEGNGDGSDGTFVYTGFKPAFLLVRKVGTNNWRVQDNTRDPYNPAYHMLVPNSSAAEDAYTDGTDYNDFLSNGFKLARGGDAANWNASGATYVYLAIAHNPFKYATAR